MSRVDDIQRDIAAERASLDQNLSMLGERLKVGNIADEAKTHALGMTDDWVQPLIERVTSNVQHRPVATALLGAGLTWLMSKPATPVAERARTYQPTGLYNGPKAAYGDPDHETPVRGATVHDGHGDGNDHGATDQIKETVSDAVDHGREKLMEVRRQVREMRAKITEGTEEMSDEARSRVIAAREKAIAAIETGGQKARRVARDGSEFVKENPALVGGIAVAVGAAIAGAFMFKRSTDDGDEVEFQTRRLSAFDDADRIFEEERNKLNGSDHTSVLAKLND